MSGRLLADACAIIVFHGSRMPRMSPAGIEAMRSGLVAVSAITVWEIARKVSLGKLAPMYGEQEGGCIGFLRERGYELLPLAPEIAERANALHLHHADPMDRMLIATALAEDMTIITSDRVFAAYGVATMW